LQSPAPVKVMLQVLTFISYALKLPTPVLKDDKSRFLVTIGPVPIIVIL